MYQEKRLILTVKDPKDEAAKAAIDEVRQIGESQAFLIDNSWAFVNGSYGSKAHMKLEAQWDTHVERLMDKTTELAQRSGADVSLAQKLLTWGVNSKKSYNVYF